MIEESEIESIEEKYNIKFTPDHREFLKVLHTIDRKKIYSHEPFEEGAVAHGYVETGHKEGNVVITLEHNSGI